MIKIVSLAKLPIEFWAIVIVVPIIMVLAVWKALHVSKMEDLHRKFLSNVPFDDDDAVDAYWRWRAQTDIHIGPF